MKIEKILKAIKGLPDEEKQQVADALSDNEEQPVEAVEEVETVEAEEAPTEEVEETPAEATEEPTAEEADIQTEAEPEATEEAEVTEEAEDGEMQVEEAEAEAPEEAPIETPEPIPEMSKEEPVEQPLQDEEGGEMPIDYSQIIDGLNAKIMALEAENKQLKAKIEGAFGLTGKPAGFTAVNKLYGDTSDIPPMRK